MGIAVLGLAKVGVLVVAVPRRRTKVQRGSGRIGGLGFWVAPPLIYGGSMGQWGIESRDCYRG